MLRSRRLIAQVTDFYVGNFKCRQFVVVVVSRSSTVSVKITLQDINDHLPTFEKRFYTVTATEAAAVNTTILTVKVSGKNVNAVTNKQNPGRARIKLSEVMPFGKRRGRDPPRTPENQAMVRAA